MKLGSSICMKHSNNLAGLSCKVFKKLKDPVVCIGFRLDGTDSDETSVRLGNDQKIAMTMNGGNVEFAFRIDMKTADICCNW